MNQTSISVLILLMLSILAYVYLKNHREQSSLHEMVEGHFKIKVCGNSRAITPAEKDIFEILSIVANKLGIEIQTTIQGPEYSVIILANPGDTAGGLELQYQYQVMALNNHKFKKT